MALNRRTRVVQSGVNTTNGNAQAIGAGYKVGEKVMPVQPRNKPWTPGWHPRNPQNIVNQ